MLRRDIGGLGLGLPQQNVDFSTRRKIQRMLVTCIRFGALCHETLDLMCATTCPARTDWPSCTRMRSMRPGRVVATAISLASMRPVPLTKPLGRFFSAAALHAHMPATVATATTPTSTNNGCAPLVLISCVLPTRGDLC